MEENTQSQQPQPVKTESEDPRDQKIKDLFSDLRPGYRLVITRLAPTWCYGWLETLEILPDDSIDLEYICSVWGGNKLRLQLQGDNRRYLKSAEIFVAHPPKYQGVVITPESWARQNNTEQPKTETAPAATAINPLDLMRTMSQMRQEDLDLFRKMTAGKNQPVYEPPKQVNQFEEFLKMAQHWKQLQSIFGELTPAPVQAAPLDDSTAMIQQITGLISAFKGNQQPPQRQQRIAPPQQRQRIAPAASPAPPAPPAKPKQNLAETLARMEKDKFSETILTALGQMDQTKRETVLMDIARSLGLMGDGETDESEDFGDEDGQPVEYDENDGVLDRAGNT